MNNKYVFNGNDWIVTSGEIVVTTLDGTRPMHPAQSKKLYDQNMQHYTQHKKPGVWWQIQYNAIIETVTTVDKYTIVELTHNNKHYHGTASRADCDKENAVTGIAFAYHRAFEKMMGGIKIGVAKYNKNNSNTRGSCPSIFVFDDYVIEQSKESLEESRVHIRKCLLGTFGVTKKEVGLKEDDDLSPIGKAYFKNKDWASYDFPAKKWDASAYHKSLKSVSEDYAPCWYINDPSSDKKLTELIHEAINGLKNNGNEPTEMRIKPVAAEKLMKELDIQYERFAGACNIGIDTCFCLKYIIDPSIDVDIIIK